MISIRNHIGDRLARALAGYVARRQLVPRIIPREKPFPGAKDYLLRHYPWGRRSEFGDRDKGKPARSFNLFIHYFGRSDAGRALHSHPHRWMLAFIVSRGYREERTYDPLRAQKWLRGTPERPIIRTVVRRALSFNFLTAWDFHRVDLLDPEAGAWTICLVGPEVQSWGFWDPLSGEYAEAGEVHG